LRKPLRISAVKKETAECRKEGAEDRKEQIQNEQIMYENEISEKKLDALLKFTKYLDPDYWKALMKSACFMKFFRLDFELKSKNLYL